MAKALQMAVIELLQDDDMGFKHSFYYWASIIPHGFAEVTIDDQLSENICSYAERRRQELGHSANQGGDNRWSIPMMLARDAYRRIENWEQTMSQQVCHDDNLRNQVPSGDNAVEESTEISAATDATVGSFDSLEIRVIS